MSTDVANEPPYSDADCYGFFMTGLFGLIDDAELAGYSPYGIELLREARELFWAEFKERHPAAWKPEAS
jgi:hypothetical protein